MINRIMMLNLIMNKTFDKLQNWSKWIEEKAQIQFRITKTLIYPKMKTQNC